MPTGEFRTAASLDICNAAARVPQLEARVAELEEAMREILAHDDVAFGPLTGDMRQRILELLPNN